MRFKIDWASFIVGRKFTDFALFYFVYTQTTAMAKHGGKTYAGGSREKYAVPTTLIFT